MSFLVVSSMQQVNKLETLIHAVTLKIVNEPCLYL